jgi:hypothetical protein
MVVSFNSEVDFPPWVKVIVLLGVCAFIAWLFLRKGR